MIKVIAIIGVLFFKCLLALSQPGLIDSLETHLKTTKSDTNRVIILNALANKYLTNQPNRATQYAEQALKLSEALGYGSGKMVALNRLGENEFRQGNYARAVEYATQSLKLAEQQKDSSRMAMAYKVLGNIHTFGFKQYDVALNYQLSALKIYEKKKDKRSIASSYGNITWIYASTNERLDEAHRLANLGVFLADSLGDRQLLSYNFNSKGLIFMQEGKLDSALKYLDKSIRLGEEIEDHPVVAYDKSIEGNVYLRKKDFKKAVQMFEESFSEGQKVNQREVLKESYEGLAKSYEGLGNYALAYKALVLHDRLKDSLVNWETSQKALITKMKFDEEKKLAKIAELELASQLSKKEAMIYNVLVGVVFLFMITLIILVVRNNQQRIETNRLLQSKNDEIARQNLKLTEANNIKDKFFSIIGHDLRSPLSSLKGLLGMVVRNEITDEEFRSFATKLHHLVIGTNETLENLLQWSHSQMDGWNYAPSSVPLQPLLMKCVSLFSEAAKTKNIALINKVDEHEIVYAEENQVELIFRNLIHNAIKFTAEGGSVRITARKLDEFVEVLVSDKGIGMTNEQLSGLFQKNNTPTVRGTHGERGTGLGLLLCKEMIENNDGKISVTSELGKGSTFHVFLKTTS